MTESGRWPMDGRAVIAALRREHQALEDALRTMESQPSPDRLQIARITKRKLELRDRIAKLEDWTRPNLIAWSRVHAAAARGGSLRHVSTNLRKTWSGIGVWRRLG
jgi:hypothetical protein